MPAFENRARMSLEDAEVRLSNPPSGGIRYVVANEDGSFSIAGHDASSESEKLEESFYDTVVVATNKTTTSPGDFVHRVQTAAAEPITLRKLIQHLIDTYRPPRTKKDPWMVIRVRIRDAYTRLGYLRQVNCCSCEGRERPLPENGKKPERRGHVDNSTIIMIRMHQATGEALLVPPRNRRIGKPYQYY